MGANRTDVLAAGAVVVRREGDDWAVLLVHRPRYDDWSFPKGKLDPGEHVLSAAVRETAEETGLRIRLGPPLSTQRYPFGADGRHKQVHYWVARAVQGDVADYRPNAEIDQVAWVPWAEAERRLSYAHDRSTLAEALPVRRRTRVLVVLRHGQASPRKEWTGDDRLRPLATAGFAEAQRLVPLLAAYDVSLVVTSSATRCVQTVQPYADAAGWPVVTHDGLTEEGAGVESVVEVVDGLLHAREDAVLCGHRPVLPSVLDAIGVAPTKLAPGAMAVVHHRRGRIVAMEKHLP